MCRNYSLTSIDILVANFETGTFWKHYWNCSKNQLNRKNNTLCGFINYDGFFKLLSIGIIKIHLQYT